MAALIGVLLFTALNMAPAMAECPTCQGTGKIVCPNCQGTGKIASSGDSAVCQACQGSGVLKPTISSAGSRAWVSNGEAFVLGYFKNEEDIGVYGTATAEMESTSTKYTAVSPRTYFPPHETIDITITLENIAYADYSYFSSQRYLRGSIMSEAESTSCPSCDGTGVVSSLASTCSECSGTGFVTCPTCGGSLVVGGQNRDASIFSGIEGIVVGVAVVAAVLMAAILVVKKKRVTEEQLRRRLPSEFQNWVIKRLSGKGSLGTSSELGIDGYTVEGYPIRVSQSDDVGRNVVTTFVTAIGRSRAKNGIIVAFSFDKSAYEEITRARLHFGPEIKAVTVKELLERGNRIL